MDRSKQDSYSSLEDLSTREPSSSRGKSAADLMKYAAGKVKEGGKKVKGKLTKSRTTVNPLSLAATKAANQTKKFLAGEVRLPSEVTTAPGIDPTKRHIELNGGNSNPGFVGNRVVTAKYNAVTFLPKFLAEYFSQVAYIYFLVQAILSWISIISPFGGVGSTVALIFVLVVGAIKALLEDKKRHAEDRKLNKSTAHLVNPDGTIKDVQWIDVEVGNILMVKDDELFPADLVCLYSNLPEKVCFIKTTNLDGETNLKIRKPLDLRDVHIAGTEDTTKIKGSLEVEQPSANLHHLKATFRYQTPAGATKQTAVTMNEMLLRGCMLKNSHYVVGMVVYTGPESRVQMNAAKTPLKVGSFNKFLNVQIVLIMILQVVMCIWGSIANYIWRETVGDLRAYLGFWSYTNGNYESGFFYWIIMLLTFWLLYSYLVPISLFVTMEIVKFWQGFVFINSDPEMVDPTSGENARARNSGLNEDLGMVEYVFSDKTGTLTSNEMQLRMISVKDKPCGRVDWKLEENKEQQGMYALETWDSSLATAMRTLSTDAAFWQNSLQAGGSSQEVLNLNNSKGFDQGGYGGADSAHLLGQHLLDFWTNICVCHSLIAEPDPKGGQAIYQGPSPDEVALVDAARQLGFEFINRTQTGVIINMLGHMVEYEILNINEFTSARGCMSVIARSPDGTIRLFCKGSDTKVLARLRNDLDAHLMEETNRNLHLFATKGLRTLLLGTKIISEQDFLEYDDRYQEAAADLDNRDELINQLADEIERDLELVGVTAIEDKLQDGVPEAIQSLLDAGIKVWMITGDKQETAINIGISCKLVHRPDSLLICNAADQDDARQKLMGLLERVRSMKNENPLGAPVTELVIDGPSLSHILGSDLEPILAEVGAHCTSVVICRSSPSQKAAIVSMMREYELNKASKGATRLLGWWRKYNYRIYHKMLGIGDGANDVAMIQRADIGIGIMGKEGRQAVNNSDYAIGQFRFLVRLLLVHGTLSSYRLARLIKYSFYKNVSFTFILFWYQFFCGYSGTTLIDGIPATLYNVVFTSMPVLLFSLLDRPVKHLTSLMRYPQLYNKTHSLSYSVFWRNGVLLAAYDGAVVFFIAYYSIRPGGTGSVTDVYSLGVVVFIGLLGVVTIEMLIVGRYWTWPWLLFVFLSYIVAFAFFLIYPFILQGTGQYFSPAFFGNTFQTMASGYFWFSLVAIYASAVLLRYFQRVWIWFFNPQDTMVLSEKEALYGPVGGKMSWQAERRLTSLVPEMKSSPKKESSKKASADSRVRLVTGNYSDEAVDKHMEAL